MEIEFTARGFAPLTGDFDFAELQRRLGPKITPGLPKDFFDHYLSQPGNFEALPEPLRKQLSQGLKLKSLIEPPKDKPAPLAAGSRLLGPDGKPIHAQAARSFSCRTGWPGKNSKADGRNSAPK